MVTLYTYIFCHRTLFLYSFFDKLHDLYACNDVLRIITKWFTISNVNLLKKPEMKPFEQLVTRLPQHLEWQHRDTSWRPVKLRIYARDITQ